MNFESIKQFFADYFNGNQTTGIIRFVVDVVIICAIIFAFFFLIHQRINVWRFLIVLLAGTAIFFVSIIFNLNILTKFMEYLGSWIVGFFIIIYAADIKVAFEGKQVKEHSDNAFNSKKEKAEIISIICQTVDYLSKRKIGALITFERKDSLKATIAPAIQINADITQEILTTIFTPGTACHDGGVIIQNNKIACAGAYYPLSDNYDIPKFLGTRHRAAIGMSEKNDSITIIVSEETGNVSLAVGGNINLQLTIERIQTLLDGYLPSK